MIACQSPSCDISYGLLYCQHPTSGNAVHDGLHSLSEDICKADRNNVDTWDDRRFYGNRFKLSNKDNVKMKGDK